MTEKNVRSATELLPWMLPLTDELVVCKDSGLLASFEFTPVDADAAGEGETAQLAYAADRLMNLFRDQPITVWWTVRRERTDDYPADPMPDEVSQLLDDEHHASFVNSGSFINRHFFSVMWMPPKGTGNLIERIGLLMSEGVSGPKAALMAAKSLFGGRDTFAWRGAELDIAVGEFEARLDQARNVLSQMHLKRLQGKAFMGFLWACANPGRRMTPKGWDGQQMLDALLPERSVEVYRDTLTFGEEGDRTYASQISLKSVPREGIDFDAFGSLLAAPCEMVLSHCFRFMSTDDAYKHIDNTKRVFDLTKYPLKTWIFGVWKGNFNESSMDPAKIEAAADMQVAKGALSSGAVQFGWHHFSLTLLGDSLQECNDAAKAVLRQFHASPFVGATRETIHALSGWATTLPGSWQECRRWLTVTSVNAVNMAPLLGVALGERENAHLTAQMGKRCQAMTVLRTEYGTPYYFNFHVGALGHAFVVGPSRSGKSAGMNFLMSQFRKYGSSARVLIFDKDYSCRPPTLLQGGEYIDLQADGDIKMNPIALVADRKHWAFVARWVEGLIASRGYQVTAPDERAIYEAVESMASLPPEMRRLKSIATNLPLHLKTELESWIEGRPYGRYFDNVEDSFSLSSFTAVEMNEVMRDTKVARAFLDYAFYRIKQMLEESRQGTAVTTLIYVEECWFLLEDEVFAARLKDWLKTFAKLNAFLVLCTQSIEDLMEVPATVFAAIRDNIPTKIFLPNPNALSETLFELYRKQFQLRADQIHRIATAQPRLEYYVVKPDVARKVQLALTSRQLAVVRTDMAAQKVFERHYRGGSPSWKSDYIEEVLTV